MDEACQRSQEPWQQGPATMKPSRWVSLSGTLLDHAQILGLTLTDIGVITSIRTLQEVDGYTRLSLSQIAELSPLDPTIAVARSIARMQRLGLLTVTVYEYDLCTYDFTPLYRRCAAFLYEEAEQQEASLLAAYQEAGQPYGPTLGGLYAWSIQKRQMEACQEGPGERSPVSRTEAILLAALSVGRHGP